VRRVKYVDFTWSFSYLLKHFHPRVFDAILTTVKIPQRQTWLTALLCRQRTTHLSFRQDLYLGGLALGNKLVAYIASKKRKCLGIYDNATTTETSAKVLARSGDIRITCTSLFYNVLRCLEIQRAFTQRVLCFIFCILCCRQSLRVDGDAGGGGGVNDRLAGCVRKRDQHCGLLPQLQTADTVQPPNHQLVRSGSRFLKPGQYLHTHRNRTEDRVIFTPHSRHRSES